MTPSVHVALIATECFPFVKVGGLADVVGSLPAEFESLGARVEIVIPDPGDLDPRLFGPAREVGAVEFTLRERHHRAQVRRLEMPGTGIGVFLIRGEGYFPRAGLYLDPSTGLDYPDQLQRWVFFQMAALTLLARDSPSLDVLHCHEHQTSLVPFYLEAVFRPAGSFANAVTVFTIHNLGYQGSFPADQWRLTGLGEEKFQPGGPVEYYGRINLMKAGIVASDALTVVSPTYANEIQTEEYGCGLDSVIRERRADLAGILNGIDTATWNPQTDPSIGACYGVADRAGKRTNRMDLLERFGLGRKDDDRPVLAIVSRIDYQKGFDLLEEVLDGLLEREVYFLLLGTGHRDTERAIDAIVSRHADRAAACFGFDNALAHQVIAGADVLLVPSRYEPCGLTQMYAMRYGTAPVVRATGGLADTVEEFDPATGQGTGFRFADYDAASFLEAIDRALDCWTTPSGWNQLMANGMTKDFGWSDSARRYLQVFEETLQRRRGLKK